MKAIRNNILPLTAIFMLILISVASVFIGFVRDIEMGRPIFSIAMGLIMICGASFVKDEKLHKASLITYISVIAILCIQLLTGIAFNPVSMRYLYVFDFFSLYTASLLPLTYMQSAKIITKYNTLGTKSLFMLIGVMCAPIMLVFLQSNIHPVIVAFFVCYIILFAIKNEKRTTVPWVAMVIPVVLIIAAAFFMYTNSKYIHIRLETIFLRGQNDPFGTGWVRTNLDGILTNTPFIGATNYSLGAIPAVKFLSDIGDHNILILLAEYGWLAFLTMIAIYACFFICLFKMVYKIKQSTFAKYTALMLGCSLLIQAVYSLSSLLLLDSAHGDIPFLSGSYSINIMNYLSFGLILSLYTKRNNVSKLKEIDAPEEKYDSLLKNKISKIISDALDEE